MASIQNFTSHATTFKVGTCQPWSFKVNSWKVVIEDAYPLCAFFFMSVLMIVVVVQQSNKLIDFKSFKYHWPSPTVKTIQHSKKQNKTQTAYRQETLEKFVVQLIQQRQRFQCLSQFIELKTRDRFKFFCKTSMCRQKKRLNFSCQSKRWLLSQGTSEDLLEWSPW